MQTQFKRSIWDYLFYTSLIILTIWLFLKVIGVINTPVWIEYGIPIGTLIFGFFTVYQSFVDRMFLITSSIARLESNDAKFEEHILHIDKDIEHINRDIEFLKTTLQR